jgi:hypothetical protein
MEKLTAAILIVAGCNANGVDITGMDPDLAVGPQMDLAAFSAGLTIPKSGPPFTGTMNDPGLNALGDCPDEHLEPNDNPATALALNPMPDQPTAKIITVAICPKGVNPLSGQHDQDWYRVDLTTGPSSLTLVAEAFYDISLGDLDIAVTDAAGNSIVADGTAVANGCVATQVTNQIYFVVVTGANNVDVNNYELLIRTFAAAHSCP